MDVVRKDIVMLANKFVADGERRCEGWMGLVVAREHPIPVSSSDWLICISN